MGHYVELTNENYEALKNIKANRERGKVTFFANHAIKKWLEDSKPVMK
jgi:hypothetical protein